jgi:hypothetical protein
MRRRYAIRYPVADLPGDCHPGWFHKRGSLPPQPGTNHGQRVASELSSKVPFRPFAFATGPSSTSQTPKLRPMISFMISVVPPYIVCTRASR